jgi:hypothetical protein
MHIEEKTELIRNMIRFQDGEVLGRGLIKYFDLLLRSLKYLPEEQGIEKTLKFMSRCEGLLDLNPL